MRKKYSKDMIGWLKEFFRPSKGKILTCIGLVLAVLVIYARTGEHGMISLVFESILLLGVYSSFLLAPFKDLPRMMIVIFLVTIELVYLYLLSCIIILVTNKFRTKKKDDK